MASTEAFAPLATSASLSIFFFWKKVAASCPPSLRPTKTPPGSCMTTSGLRFVEYVSLEGITGTVLDAGSRLKIWSVP